jgi:hypothetical protein
MPRSARSSSTSRYGQREAQVPAHREHEVTLPQLATLPTDGAVFYITVRHDQVVKLAQQYLP